LKDFALERTDDRIVSFRFYTDRSPRVYTSQTYADFAVLPEAIGLDRDNRVLTLKGTGDVFTESIEAEGLGEICKPGLWGRTIRIAGSRCSKVRLIFLFPSMA
jgi:hypothetical protein